MKNDTSEQTGIVESVSRFMGGLVGTLVVASKGVASRVKNTMAAELESKPTLSTNVAESAESQAKERIVEVEEEKATSEEAEEEAKLEEKAEKSELSNDSQSCLNPEVSEETSVAAKSQKRRPTVTKKKASNVEHDESSDKS